MKRVWILSGLVLGAAAAFAHVNDRGMDYESYKTRQGISCCGDQDCRPAADFVVTVADGRDVVRLLIDGHWIAVPRSYVVDDRASDGRAHYCGRFALVGSPTTVKAWPICVILPPHDT